MQKEIAPAGITPFTWIALITPILASIAILWLQIRSNDKLERMKGTIDMITHNALSIRNDERNAIVRFNETIQVYYQSVYNDHKQTEEELKQKQKEEDLVRFTVQPPTREDLARIDALRDQLEIAFANLNLFVTDDSLKDIASKMMDETSTVRMYIGFYYANCIYAGLEKVDVMTWPDNLAKVHREMWEQKHRAAFQIPMLTRQFHERAREYLYRIHPEASMR